MKNKYFVVYEIFKNYFKGLFYNFCICYVGYWKMKYVLDFLSFIIVYYFK